MLLKTKAQLIAKINNKKCRIKLNVFNVDEMVSYITINTYGSSNCENKWVGE